MKKNIIILFIFLFGLYICLNYTSKRVESMGNRQHHCPDIILKKGNKIFLKKSGKAVVPGINPIEFNNLNEYVEFLNWQRSQNIKCPVLYLEESYNAQGKRVYKMRPNMFYPQGGLNSYNPEDPEIVSTAPKYEEAPLTDASHDDPSYNANNYPGFDPENQYIGLDVPLDKMFHEQQQMAQSDNPMDNNWGGVTYAQDSVKSGKYTDDNVKISIN